MRTIAFDNKRGIWKTRYSFISACIGWIRNVMVTTPTAIVGGNLLWTHRDSDTEPEANNSFYGLPSVPSAVSFSFNDNPSVNKQFKSWSIETANPTEIVGIGLLDVNSGGGNAINKAAPLGRLIEKGGIMYGPMGQEARTTISNLEFAGVVESVDSVYNLPEAEVGPDFLPTILGYNFADFPNAVFLTMSFLDPLALSSRSAVVTNDPVGFKDTGASQGLLSSDLPVIFNGGIILLSGTIAAGDRIYFAYGSEVNGEAPKGQFADAYVTLGSEDFEVYGFNAEYSPTNLDHSN